MNGSGTYAGGGYIDLSGERYPPAERADEQCGCGACREVMHASSCAVHNEPAERNGPCDCGPQAPSFSRGFQSSEHATMSDPIVLSIVVRASFIAN